jgi:dipeptidyl aminopeptidase/acylaminoacyl peptidase
MRYWRAAGCAFVAFLSLVLLGVGAARSREALRPPHPLQFRGSFTYICNVQYVDGFSPEICLDASPVTNDRLPAHNPDWTSDGTRVAFDRGGSIYARSVWLSNAFHGTSRRVVSGVQPAWSPSGNYLAYAAGSGRNHDIYIVRDTGTGMRRITSGGQDDSAPAWSPRGGTIAYTRGSTIRLVAVDGTRDRLLGEGQTPDWSVDGKRLVFEHAGDIWLAKADGTGRRNVTRTPGLRETSPVWSPDEQALIAYTGRDSSGEVGLYMQYLGRGAVRLLAEPVRESPFLEPVVDWQPVRVLVASVSKRKPVVSLRDARGHRLRMVRAGCYSSGYVDRSAENGITFTGVGFSFIGLNPFGPSVRKTVRYVGRHWPKASHVRACGWIRPGRYRFWDPAHPRLRGTFTVVDRP